MGKNRTQKPSVMREAANKRAEYRKWLVRLVVGLVICLAAIGAYYLLVINYVIENAPGVTWILAAIAANLPGMVWQQVFQDASSLHRLPCRTGLTNEDVVEFLKTNGRDNPRA